MANGFIPTQSGPHIPVEVPEGTTLATVADIVAAAWSQGVLTAASPINGVIGSVKDGAARVPSDAIAVALGLPGGKAGDFNQISFGTYGFHSHTTTLGVSGRQWSNLSQAWGPWSKPSQTYADDAAAAVNWYRGVLGPSNTFTHADSAPGGTVTVWSGSNATAVGLPEGDLGDLFTVLFGSGGTQKFSTVKGHTWARGRVNGVWGTFVRTDAGVVAEVARSVVATETARDRPGSGLKVIPLSLTLGQVNANAPLVATYRIPQKWNAPITRWRICGTNRSVRNAAPMGTGIEVTGIWAGAHAGNGAFTVAPTRVSGAFTMPENGDVWRSGWINAVDIGGDADVLFSYDYTAVTAPPLQVAGAYASAAQVGAEVAPAGLTLGKSAALDFWIEAETYAGTPVVAVLGDSLASGAQATLPCYDSVGSIYARSHGALPVHYAVSSDTLNDWIIDPAEHKVARWDHLTRADSVLFTLGHNDVYGLNRTLAQYQADIFKAIPIIQEHISGTIIGATITPRTSGTTAQHAVRDEINAWLPTLVSNGYFRELFDFNATVANGNALKPEYDADGTHLNTAGYTAEAAILRNLTSPAVAYATV